MELGEQIPSSLPPRPRDLFLAIRHGNIDEVVFILKHGGNPNWKDRRGEETALAYATRVSTAAVVQLLLANGASDNGKMPLANSVSWNRNDDNSDPTAIPRLLIEHGGDVNHADATGHTPLMEAAAAGDAPTAQLFLIHGANVEAKNRAGQTALAIALSYDHRDIAEMLRQAGAVS